MLSKTEAPETMTLPSCEGTSTSQAQLFAYSNQKWTFKILPDNGADLDYMLSKTLMFLAVLYYKEHSTFEELKSLVDEKKVIMTCKQKKRGEITREFAEELKKRSNWCIFKGLFMEIQSWNLIFLKTKGQDSLPLHQKKS